MPKVKIPVVKIPAILKKYLDSIGFPYEDEKGNAPALLFEAEFLRTEFADMDSEWRNTPAQSKKALTRFIERMEAEGVVPDPLPETMEEEEPAKPSEIDVVIIDTEMGSVFKQTIENSLSEFYKTIGCSCIDIAVLSFSGQIVDCIVDDEGMLKSGAIVSVIDAKGEPQLVGNVIFTGYDKVGNTVSLTEEQANAILSNIAVAQYSDGKMRMIARCDAVE